MLRLIWQRGVSVCFCKRETLKEREREGSVEGEEGREEEKIIKK